MQPTRRTVLAAGALSVVAACHRDGTPPPVDPDVALRQAALDRELVLLAGWQRLMGSDPVLAAVAAGHAAHVAELGTAPVTPPPTALTRAQLVALERVAATEHGRAALVASRDLAPLLASLSASSACALELLR